MDDLKRLGYPVLIIFLSAFVVKMIDQYMVFKYSSMLITLLVAGALFLFGASLNKSRKKRNQSAFKKVLAILIVVLLMLMQLDYFRIPYIDKIFDLFGIGSFFINMIYIFCGYLFAD